MSGKVRGALIWSFAERYASLVVTLASTMLLARLLTPQEIGVFSVCAAFVTIATVLRDFGISEYLIQEKQLDDEKLRAAYAGAIVIGWGVGAIAMLARHPLAVYLKEPAVVEVIGILALNFAILPFASPAFALLNRNLQFRRIFVIQFSSSFVHAGTGVILAMNGFGFRSLAWASVANTAFQALLLLVMRSPGTLLMPSFKGMRHVFGYGSYFVLSRLLETFTRNAHEFIIARSFGLTSVGLFSRALGLLEMFYSNVTSAVLRVATPVFADQHRSGTDLSVTYAQSTALMTAIAWPFFGYVALMSHDIMRLLLGPQWDAAAPICSLLALAIMPTYLYSFGPNLLNATGNVSKRLRINLIYSPVHLVVLVIASRFNLETLAASWVVSHLVALSLYVYYMRTLLGASTRTLLGPSLKSALVAAGSIGPQALMAQAGHHYDWPLLVNLLTTGAAGLAGLVITAQGLHHPLAIELSRAFHGLRQRMTKRVAS
ncbi:lipopolysaccharide biosynthesis protein [Roseateles sp. So40a]|uniref:lipopolysaccharide biosynthesis protein n=1 Tax=Roseateles sp. So40a TaxID=3400226 RepID=UPI003A894CCF